MIKKLSFSIFCFLFTILCVVGFIISNLKNNQNFFVYPLDDTYIHLAIAKTFSNYQIWGVTKYQFVSATSSPLYTLIISIFIKIFGNCVFIPLFINILFCLLFFTVFYKTNKERLNDFMYVLTLAIITFFIPLFHCILLGLEHTMHLFFTYLLFHFFVKIYSEKNLKKDIIQFHLVIALCMVTRYESIFMITLISFCFLLQKRWLSITTFTTALFPIIIYGLISIKNGDQFLPNTLLAKGSFIKQYNIGFIIDFIIRKVEYILSNAHILQMASLLIAVAILVVLKSVQININRCLSILFIAFGSLIAQGIFAQYHGYYRYENYLILFVTLSIIFSIHEMCFSVKNKSQLLFILLLTGILFIPFILRNISIIYFNKNAPKNIYDQQIQISRFLSKFKTNTFAISDLGAICYYTENRIIDIAGLGTPGVLKLNQKKAPLDAVFEKENVTIVATHATFYNSFIPKKFKPICTFTINNNIVCGEPTVTFFAKDSLVIKSLLNHIHEQATKCSHRQITIKTLEPN
jgi:hypothetical protein